MYHYVSSKLCKFILDDVDFDHGGRALSCVCGGFPQVSLGYQHASGGKENAKM